MKIAFLRSIYPAHSDEIYREHPDLKYKTSDEQMEFIRWHALSSYTKWDDYFKSKDCEVLQFHHNLDHVEKNWASENGLRTSQKNCVLQIGLEKIKKFKPDIIYCSSALFYMRSNFLKELIGCLPKRPQLVSWYGANCGDEEIFRFFDLTLSNSKHLVNSLRKKKIFAEFLQHSFEPSILDKINIPESRINKLGFFGNLDCNAADFKDRTQLLSKIFNIDKILEIHGTTYKPNQCERFKYYAIKNRHNFSRIIANYLPLGIFKKWSEIENLPPSPWPLEKNFSQQIKPALFGHKMLQSLSKYQIAFNYHNKHTGDYACNMRLFESTGIGCCLLTDQKSDISSIFEADKEVVTYANHEEAISKAKCLIREPKLAREIALSGQKRTLTDYTTENQVDQLLLHLRKLLN